MLTLTLEEALKVIEEETGKIEQMARDIKGTRFEDLLYSEDLHSQRELRIDELFV